MVAIYAERYGDYYSSLIESGKCKNVALIGRKQVSLFSYHILLCAEKEQYNVDANLDIFDGAAMQALQRKRNDDESGAGYEQNQGKKIHFMMATLPKGHEYDAVIIL